METIDILDELDKRGKLRGATIGGYIVRQLSKPPIFTTEVLSNKGYFAEIKIMYTMLRGTRRLPAVGKLVAYVPNEVPVQDFYELKGTVSLGGFGYTRLVTMMTFSKIEGSGDKPIWAVSPVGVSDIEITRLNTQLSDEVMRFVEQPLTYEMGSLKHVLKPVSEATDSTKVYFDFKGLSSKDYVGELPTKETKDFEKETGYLVDSEFEIIREGLRFRVLALDISDFRGDTTLIEYVKWLVDDNIEVVSNLSEVKDEGCYLVVTSEDLEGVPFIRLKRGVLSRWGI